MTQADRREFLRKLAGGVAYSAPFVYTMAAPMEVVAQSGKGWKASGKGHGHGHGHGMGMSGMADFVQPPGERPPGGGG